MPRSTRRPVLALTLLALAGSGCRSDQPLSIATFGALSTAQNRGKVLSGLAASRRTAIVDAAERVGPAVVSVSVTSHQRVQQQASPFDFFFVPQEGEQVVQGYGTGFVIRPDGIIVTNQHVVAGADSIVVTLRDGTDLHADLLGEDPVTDIAVLRVARKGLAVATLGHSDDLMIGEWAVALGNPFAYYLGNADPTVTAGVISATGRNILPGRDQSGLYLDMIQTDAAINPGNSGGPLVNALGEVVGVNSSIFSKSGGSEGLGFAIPIERAMRVADEIIRQGSVRRAWTGLDVAGSEEIENWKSQGGGLVRLVAPGGPADRAGLRRGDVLVQANGRQLRNYLDWEAVKLDLDVGDSIRLVVRPQGGERTVSRLLVSGDLPTVSAEKVTVLKGMQLISLTPQIRAERRVRSEQGALIFRIASGISEQTGLEEGDVIVGINRSTIESAEEVRQLLDGMRSRQPLRVWVERNGQVAYTDLMFR
ncbi:MAG TPA: trypsin-like peptidase domain-containing protein [Gemmatimonadales bacterium]|nr:trypsin-like peptidase domain-containing protein [Gemmatimonadales bacterium]